MRLRLLQARTSADPVRAEERQQFAARLGIAVEHILPFDLLIGQTTYEQVTSGVDGVLVGGAGAFSVLDTDPWLRPFMDTMAELADTGFPTFASCFGFQAMVVALGGEVIHDPDNAEIGSFILHRADIEDDCPVFGHLPGDFWAQLGHKDRAAHLPGSARNLVASERCPYQALQIDDKPVYATQFHPELTGAENLGRLDRYHDEYITAFGAKEVARMREAFIEGPEANALLRRFVEHLERLHITERDF